ncbi:Uncharacterised protein [Mycobacterium tuberculosis]|nr:Uncharacterised protein [Mycobacterium tuberculosis]
MGKLRTRRDTRPMLGGGRAPASVSVCARPDSTMLIRSR